ncbi:50S ribosomal protein L3 [Candidatus Azambacteria bacterium RIFCSPHIGHO2_01_46_10]|uniref:Large ribosomal subunit protein uL3 n=6 Tax=Parcubacteria group TaxID=1794811 RepID=A0A0H4TKA4_9BACT|nr:Ribosomal protein L3, large subunit ribosomal protein L3 [uncultured Parcubacteria bacterium Rifle_16ft_4_minimus_12547]OGD30067.1 MAG: 50S ribosomal protein L3 [Candidatus Azambacteria bacterium RIFCSPHIGHO2_02_46_12]OGD35460.1 MAG: 50S ribosomal protein L3 [Candidatus Azambacteria bacterium RIFCSPHIGHO2_01_46_10]OGD38499.1 MAG: 50S ribosomal protein L3 [Candidatus Azambacteria bacterium RIFCSPLOWO2_01_FULL_46_26]OGD44779.1 MAG: 50S ribosomal protein L3 [Candidatus Azambacteria bacterium RI
MGKFILGQKIGMSQIFGKEGEVIPVSVIEAGPCVVIQIKSPENDGYQAVQIGFGERKKVSKPLAGHLKNLGKFRHLREFKGVADLKVGDKIGVGIFQEGDRVKVSGVSKGKGFQGVVKRHGFSGGMASHGNKDRLRAPGSIGTSFPEHVRKGRRMAGRMGFDRVSVKDVKIVKVDQENNILAVKGAVPGRKGTLLEISSRN